MATRTKTSDDARRLLGIADRARRGVRRDVERALRDLQGAVPVARLERAIARGDAFELHDIAASLPLRLRPAVATLERVFMSAGQAGRTSLPSGVHVGGRFDATNPYAVAAAKENGARMVREVTGETREAIRTVVGRSFSEGIPPRDAARLIRPLIGLTSRQARAVERRYAASVADGLSRRAALEASEAEAARMLSRRALTIARTETLRAANGGQIAAWKEAQALGLLSPRSEKVWIVTPDDRLCPFCAPLDGKRAVGLDGMFATGLFKRVTGPPLHPNCRCAVALKPASAVAAVQAASAVAVASRAFTAARVASAFVPGARTTRRALRTARPTRTGRAEILNRPTSAYPPANPFGRDTLSKHTMQSGTLTPQRRQLHDAIIDEHLSGHSKVDRPTALVMGGGPASGKSSILGEIEVGKRVHIDVDRIRTMLPEYKDGVASKDAMIAAVTHEESSVLAKRLAEIAGSDYDILIDGTGDNSYESLAKKIATYRSSGQRVVGHYVTVDTETAVQRMIARGKETGRYVPETYLRSVHRGVSDVLPRAMREGLFDEVSLWDTNSGRPVLVATARDGQITVIDAALWERFLMKAFE